MTAHFRTVNRGANPFAPIAKQRNQALTTPRNGVYEKLEDRVNTYLSDPDNNKIITAAVERLRQRLGGEIYQQDHFGRFEIISIPLEYINIDIQRDITSATNLASIIDLFDPRCVQPVNCTYITETGMYSAWDGQQTSTILKILLDAGLINPDFKVLCKVYDDTLEVPGSTLKGEAAANYLFRVLNTSREPIDAYWLHRSRVSGVRNYGSELREDKQAEQIQQIFERNHMFPAKPADAQGQKAKPGMVTYISGCNSIAGLGTEDNKFEITVQDLNRALIWHDRYYASEKGVEGGFILAFGRLYAEARDQNIDITRETEDDLYALFKAKYATPSGFHKDCKQRLGDFQEKNKLKKSWSDSCLTPILVMDYLNWSKSKNYPLPEVNHMTTYAGI
jgi:hypothetical protein